MNFIVAELHLFIYFIKVKKNETFGKEIEDEFCHELCSLLAFASVAKDSEYIRPNLTRDDVLQIKGGR